MPRFEENMQRQIVCSDFIIALCIVHHARSTEIAETKVGAYAGPFEP